jgi:hypothetical protein
MSDKVIVATAPDDVLIDAFRLLLVDLNSVQSKTISDALLELSLDTNVVVYLWKSTDPVSWLLDKRSKANLIIFNADSTNDIIVGYMAAQKKSHYFGNLKLLSGANVANLYAMEDCVVLLKRSLDINL